jgi:hypothetical protein
MFLSPLMHGGKTAGHGEKSGSEYFGETVKNTLNYCKWSQTIIK